MAPVVLRHTSAHQTRHFSLAWTIKKSFVFHLIWPILWSEEPPELNGSTWLDVAVHPGPVMMAKEQSVWSVYFRDSPWAGMRSIPCKFCGCYTSGEEMGQMLVEATHLFAYIDFLQMSIHSISYNKKNLIFENGNYKIFSRYIKWTKPSMTKLLSLLLILKF